MGRKVVVQIDWYTKVVLTLIAVLLAGILVKPYIAIRPGSAFYGDAQDVRVVNDFPIEVRGTVRVNNKEREAIPVEIAENYIGEVDAYITGEGLSHAITVVDWKEKEQYIEEQREKLREQRKE